jgi:PadR family transcriptional regulator PadR
MHRTRPLEQVATALLADPGGQHMGADLSRRSGILPGSLYPMLLRMVNNGWLVDGWEDQVGMPRRRYYQLTPAGKRRLSDLTGI